VNIGPRSRLFGISYVQYVHTFLEFYRGSRLHGTGRENSTTTDHFNPEGGRSRARALMAFIVSI
jgi:hypothetical protein